MIKSWFGKFKLLFNYFFIKLAQNSLYCSINEHYVRLKITFMSNSEKYSKIFMKAFSVNKSKLNKLKYQSVTKWDSVGHMGMIAKLEEAFNITFEMDDIIDFSSFSEGKKILKKYKIKI